MTTYSGKFIPRNPKKYKGDPTQIIFRSSWECMVMKYLDTNPNVLEWQGDRVKHSNNSRPNGFYIPYTSPVDGKTHRYYPDFIALVRKADGNVVTVVIEVKPFNQTKEPKQPKRKTRRYLTEVMTYAVNTEKWKSAEEFCSNRGWIFKIITEKELGLS